MENLLNKIHFADCLGILRQLPDRSVDLLLQDPPYGSMQCDWDKSVSIPEMWTEWERVIKDNGAMIFTAQNPFSADLIVSRRGFYRYSLVWDKVLPTGFLDANKKPLRAHEDILVFYKSQPTYNPQFSVGEKYKKPRGRIEKNQYGAYGERPNGGVNEDGKRFPTSIISISNADRGKEVGHPTQKPVDLFRYLIRTYTNPGDVVFDGYGGSGTTAIAAQMEGRKFIVCENHLPYFKASTARLANLLASPYLFSDYG